MILIGEKLNSSIPKTKEALQNGDYAYIQQMVRLQESCGADYIDINTAVFEEAELDLMKEVIRIVLAHSSCGIVIDSPCVSTIEKAVEYARERPVIINSVTIDERLDEVCGILNSPAYRDAELSVIGLPIRQSGVPETPAQRKECTDELVAALTKKIDARKIWVDLVVQSVALSEQGGASDIFGTLTYLKERYPQLRTTGGITNISYGLPQRIQITAPFLGILNYLGLDSAIIDVTNPAIQKMLLATDLLCGKDEYCMNYIEYIRAHE